MTAFNKAREKQDQANIILQEHHDVNVSLGENDIFDHRDTEELACELQKDLSIKDKVNENKTMIKKH